uniref:Uncharacterized protein n=1 Tax=Sphaerodactylus townsendi TaxID=933632 RepID=A0ACB8FSE5_9SAUR
MLLELGAHGISQAQPSMGESLVRHLNLHGWGGTDIPLFLLPHSSLACAKGPAKTPLGIHRLLFPAFACKLASKRLSLTSSLCVSRNKTLALLHCTTPLPMSTEKRVKQESRFAPLAG